ncbi:Bis(5'-nucleosyl)-tetraphosphatase [asymmetrical] [Yarrowia sp. B02]|nr:Bis(5'-nucleosyl)-tetraphosphatase [asymmetrical] [Yarrowia sp. B02]
MASVIKFGAFPVTKQKTPYTFAFVNLMPIVPGHVLVSPLRVVDRVSDLTEEEASDFFLTVKKVAAVIEKEYPAQSLNIAIQDGPLAGQTIPHVHCHVIPRVAKDLESVDAIYRKMDAKEYDQEEGFAAAKKLYDRDAFAGGIDAGTPPRSAEDMEAEAQKLAKNFDVKARV